jgi:hypothetical protein
VANGLWYNLSYLFTSWKLGRWELATKVLVIQEVCTLDRLPCAWPQY